MHKTSGCKDENDEILKSCGNGNVCVLSSYPAVKQIIKPDEDGGHGSHRKCGGRANERPGLI